MTKAFDPDLAIVPRLDTNSPRLIPKPVSFNVMVPAASSVVILISKGMSASAMEPSPATYMDVEAASEKKKRGVKGTDRERKRKAKSSLY